MPDALSRRDQGVPGNGDDRLAQRIMSLLPKWNKIVRAHPVEMPNATTPFQDEELTKLWNQALVHDKSYEVISKTVQSMAIQWPPSLKIRGIELSQCAVDE